MTSAWSVASYFPTNSSSLYLHSLSTSSLLSSTVIKSTAFFNISFFPFALLGPIILSIARKSGEGEEREGGKGVEGLENGFVTLWNPSKMRGEGRG